MKTIILVTLCLCLMVSVINADKSHKHQGKLLKSGPEEHKKHTEVQPVKKDEVELKTHNPTNEQPAVAKPAGSGRKHRNNHHGKNKKGNANAETHTSRSRKTQTKPNKHNGQQQKSHNNKHHGRKHGRGKQAQ